MTVIIVDKVSITKYFQEHMKCNLKYWKHSQIQSNDNFNRHHVAVICLHCGGPLLLRALNVLGVVIAKAHCTFGTLCIALIHNVVYKNVKFAASTYWKFWEAVASILSILTGGISPGDAETFTPNAIQCCNKLILTFEKNK